MKPLASATVRPMVRIGMLGALSFLLMYLLEIPIPPFPAFLRYDPGDVPAMFAAFTMGPGAGATVVTVKALLYSVVNKGGGGVIGLLANLLGGLALTLVIGYAARHGCHRFVAITGGVLAFAAVMAVGNQWLFLPAWGVPVAQRWGMVVAAITPFNLLKGTLDGLITGWLLSRLPDERIVREPSGQRLPIE